MDERINLHFSKFQHFAEVAQFYFFILLLLLLSQQNTLLRKHPKEKTT